MSSNNSDNFLDPFKHDEVHLDFYNYSPETLRIVTTSAIELVRLYPYMLNSYHRSASVRKQSETEPQIDELFK